MRPLGVALVGFYQILRGVLALLFGLSILLFAGLSAKLVSMAARAMPSNTFCAASDT